MPQSHLHRASVWMIALLMCGCATSTWTPPPHSSVAPASQPSASLSLDSSQIQPMYQELLAIDLPTVVRVAAAQNLDVEQARQRVAASRGRYESSVEALIPVIAPTVAFQHVEGVNQNATGTLSPVSFNTFIPAIALQWILNPGRVVYDIVAAKRRLEASQQQEAAVRLETTRTAVAQYYDLILSQARLAAAHQSVAQAEELSRIAALRARNGTGLAADELRAQASLAGYQQDLAIATYNFLQASVGLTLTLRLDPTVTLVPQGQQLSQIMLVSNDVGISQLLDNAAQYRPDLESFRTLVRAAQADKKSTGWGGLGPQVQAGYSYGGLESQASGVHFPLDSQQRAGVAAGFALDASTFGRLKTGAANERLAELDLQRRLDSIRAAVVSAQQNSITQAKLVPIARQQLQSAEEALRLTQANLQAGTMLTLDVLEAQRSADEARLRFSEAVVRYNQAQVNLLAAMGMLDERSLFPQTTPPSTTPSREPADGGAVN